ncbi:MAG: hypothetical protein FWJ66_06445 [Caldibacillus sp.]
MSVAYYHNLCSKNIGRPCTIRTIDGRIHRGIITRVTRTHVFLRPFPSGPHRNPTYYGYGFWGFGIGLGIGIALGAIIAISFAWWW